MFLIDLAPNTPNKTRVTYTSLIDSNKLFKQNNHIDYIRKFMTGVSVSNSVAKFGQIGC